MPSRAHFTALVEDALREIPNAFRSAMTNVAVVVEDDPPPDFSRSSRSSPGDTLFGLYQGTPLPERSWSHGNTLPDRISIYQQPIVEACADEDEIRDCVAENGHPRVRPLLRHERGRDRGDRGEVLARRADGRRLNDAHAQALRPAFPRERLGRQGRRGDRAAASRSLR
jgi:predicted Zn-dependent protease with MMP-like domain